MPSCSIMTTNYIVVQLHTTTLLHSSRSTCSPQNGLSFFCFFFCEKKHNTNVMNSLYCRHVSAEEKLCENQLLIILSTTYIKRSITAMGLVLWSSEVDHIVQIHVSLFFPGRNTAPFFPFLLREVLFKKEDLPL